MAQPHEDTWAAWNRLLFQKTVPDPSPDPDPAPGPRERSKQRKRAKRSEPKPSFTERLVAKLDRGMNPSQVRQAQQYTPRRKIHRTRRR